MAPFSLHGGVDREIRVGGSVAFSPATLFKLGEQGAWYDPSDLSTMFQDSAGTIPVTASGQPVGLMLDKRLPKGPELIANGNFSDGITGWAAVGTSVIEAVNGALRISSTSINQGANQFVPTVVGKTYEVKWEVSGGAPRLFFGGSALNGSFGRAVFTAVSNSTEIRLSNSETPRTSTWDNVSVREVPGNHRTQPTTAARPTLMQENGLWYLQPDGVDDFMLTPTFDWGTDKMSIVNGLRRADLANTRMVMEQSTNMNSFPGTMYFLSVDAGSRYWCSTAKGTAGAAPQQAAYLTAPVNSLDKAVVTILHDISVNLSRTRRNSVYGVDGIGNKGTGNFGNHPWYYYMRGGSTLPFNGRDYGSISINRLLTEAEMQAAEKWMAVKTGVVL